MCDGKAATPTPLRDALSSVRLVWRSVRSRTREEPCAAGKAFRARYSRPPPRARHITTVGRGKPAASGRCSRPRAGGNRALAPMRICWLSLARCCPPARPTCGRRTSRRPLRRGSPNGPSPGSRPSAGSSAAGAGSETKAGTACSVTKGPD